jgi:hypothetical protein
VRTEPDEVRVDAGQLSEEDADPYGTFWNFKSEKFLDGEAVTEVVGEWAEVVDTISEGHNLLIELGLAGFLNTGVEITDFGIETDDDFPVDLEHEAEHAVGGRVLRSHVKDHVLIF